MAPDPALVEVEKRLRERLRGITTTDKRRRSKKMKTGHAPQTPSRLSAGSDEIGGSPDSPPTELAGVPEVLMQDREEYDEMTSEEKRRVVKELARLHSFLYHNHLHHVIAIKQVYGPTIRATSDTFLAARQIFYDDIKAYKNQVLDETRYEDNNKKSAKGMEHQIRQMMAEFPELAGLVDEDDLLEFFDTHFTAENFFEVWNYMKGRIDYEKSTDLGKFYCQSEFTSKLNLVFTTNLCYQQCIATSRLKSSSTWMLKRRTMAVLIEKPSLSSTTSFPLPKSSTRCPSLSSTWSTWQSEARATLQMIAQELRKRSDRSSRLVVLHQRPARCSQHQQWLYSSFTTTSFINIRDEDGRQGVMRLNQVFTVESEWDMA